MANRTLRRDHASVSNAANTFPISTRSNSDSESERVERVENTDPIVVGDSNESESDVDNVGGVGSVTIDPEQLSEYINGTDGRDDNGESRKRRKRGPNKRTTGKTGKAKAEASVEPFLLMAHNWAAVLLKTPEIALSEMEAKQLSDAYSNFCEYHEIPILTPKRMSEIDLIAAMCLVYGSRFVAVRNRMKEDKAAKRARNITPIDQTFQQAN
jgi:hypothetical protein